MLGIVCTAPTPTRRRSARHAVLLTNVVAALSKAGTKGTLRRTLDAIGKQTKPITVVVRVAEGKDEAGRPRTSSAPSRRTASTPA
ncbi:hypothetical protein [Burkholderia gladioli]|uniref:hypothetical protein n=1 Tax=Burkholderia gladioli TaxID=28095 RepID=UPI002AB1437F|nr:hypothetical protein [Burkholderia gladioli]